jgi:hypothetical protein
MAEQQKVDTGAVPKEAETDFDGEVRFLAEHTDLSPKQARELIDRYGNDRDMLLEKARSIKAES